MDLKAKKLVSTMKNATEPSMIPKFPSQKVTLHLSHNPIFGDIQTKLQQHRYVNDLEKRLLGTFSTAIGSLHSIEWKGLDVEFSSLSMQHKISRMKIVYQLLPTRSLLFQRNHDTSRNHLENSHQLSRSATTAEDPIPPNYAMKNASL